MKPETADTVKNGLIIALVILIGLFGFFGGKKVTKYASEIAMLKMDKNSLVSQNMLLEAKIKDAEAKIELKERKIDSSLVVFEKKDKQIVIISKKLNDALAELSTITSDSSYIFLKTVAYNYPGLLKYIFNENQLRHIHADYLTARNAEQAIPLLNSQIDNCKYQYAIRDSIESGLKRVIKLQKQNIGNCEKVNTNNDKIIKDTEKQRDAEKRRKNFWRFTTAVTTTTTIILAVFGL
jgi:hypothetical protein